MARFCRAHSSVGEAINLFPILAARMGCQFVSVGRWWCGCARAAMYFRRFFSSSSDSAHQYAIEVDARARLSLRRTSSAAHLHSFADVINVRPKNENRTESGKRKSLGNRIGNDSRTLHRVEANEAETRGKLFASLDEPIQSEAAKKKTIAEWNSRSPLG